MFSRPMSSMKLLSRMCDASGNLKSELADYKPEILTCQPVYNVVTQFHGQYPCFIWQRIQLTFAGRTGVFLYPRHV